MAIEVQNLCEALRHIDNIRNVCVIAHVDHGKTSLCDHLIASNGYMSKRAAGSARYMDAREDEQNRFITIKSSAIPLLHQCDDHNYVINLIDSPGHVDFSVEVSAAARLCDGALLVVDVLEGFASQSKMVLKQAWTQGLRLLLVINKMDRLFTEARLAPSEIYSHIRDVLENVNAGVHQCISDMLETDDQDVIDAVFEECLFSPEKNNVVFASATDGWAFSLDFFAQALAKKLAHRTASQKAISEETLAKKLMKAFWGDYYLDTKTQQVKCGKAKLNIVTSFAFEPLSEIYHLSETRDAVALGKFIELFGITDVSVASALKNAESLARQLLSRWLPCSRNCLNAIVRHLPDPHRSLPTRLTRFGGGNTGIGWGPDEPTVLYIGKSMNADLSNLRITADRLHGRERLADFVGFGRLFSGKLRKGDKLFVCDGTERSQTHPQHIFVRDVYLPAGMDLLRVDEAPVGSIVAVSFTGDGDSSSLFEESIASTVQWLLSLKSDACTEELTHDAHEVSERRGFNPVDRCVTLSSDVATKSFESVYRKLSVGILRLGVGPSNLSDWPAFLRGLALLYRADPAVTIEITDSGEFIICLQGEVHSERVLQDLRQLYCPDIQLTVSPPLISIRESIVNPPKEVRVAAAVLDIAFPPWNMEVVSEQERREFKISNLTLGSSKANDLRVRVRAVPMPEACLTWMDNHLDAIQDAFHDMRPSVALGGTSAGESQAAALTAFSNLLPADLSGQGRTVALCVESDCRTALMTREACRAEDLRNEEGEEDMLKESFQSIVGALKAGFRNASRSGPLCEEPVRGVVFVVESVLGMKVTKEKPGSLTSQSASSMPTLTAGSSFGTLIGCARAACRDAMLARGCTRLYELMLKMEVQCDESVLGKVHDLLAQRRSTVLSQVMDERTFEFKLIVRIPANETIDLSGELRRKSSGKASLNFEVDRWLLIAGDPYPEALMTSELEEEEGAGSNLLLVANVARRLIGQVRTRKGLPTGLKIVTESANKQRTLGKSK